MTITGKQARNFLKRMNYTKPVFENELDAVRQVMRIKVLGFPVNVNDIEKELTHIRAKNEREWDEACAEEIGYVVKENGADQLHELVELALTDPAHDRYSPEAEQEHQAADAKDLLDTQEGARY